MKTEGLEAGRGIQGWVQVALYSLVLAGSIVVAAATANYQIGDLTKRQDKSDGMRSQDHDTLNKLLQRVDDMHEWLRPAAPWERIK